MSFLAAAAAVLAVTTLNEKVMADVPVSPDVSVQFRLISIASFTIRTGF